jgi:hypothetical protein
MSAPTLADTDPRMDEARQIREFWAQHHDELLAVYPEQFVAVKDGEVVAANPDLAMLVYELRDKRLDPRKDVLIEFITARASTLLL